MSKAVAFVTASFTILSPLQAEAQGLLEGLAQRVIDEANQGVTNAAGNRPVPPLIPEDNARDIVEGYRAADEAQAMAVQLQTPMVATRAGGALGVAGGIIRQGGKVAVGELLDNILGGADGGTLSVESFDLPTTEDTGTWQLSEPEPSAAEVPTPGTCIATETELFEMYRAIGGIAYANGQVIATSEAPTTEVLSRDPYTYRIADAWICERLGN